MYTSIHHAHLCPLRLFTSRFAPFLCPFSTTFGLLRVIEWDELCGGDKEAPMKIEGLHCGRRPDLGREQAQPRVLRSCHRAVFNCQKRLQKLLTNKMRAGTLFRAGISKDSSCLILVYGSQVFGTNRRKKLWRVIYGQSIEGKSWHVLEYIELDIPSSHLNWLWLCKLSFCQLGM